MFILNKYIYIYVVHMSIISSNNRHHVRHRPVPGEDQSGFVVSVLPGTTLRPIAMKFQQLGAAMGRSPRPVKGMIWVCLKIVYPIFPMILLIIIYPY